MISFVVDAKAVSINRTYRVVRVGQHHRIAMTDEATAFRGQVQAGAAIAVGHARPAIPAGDVEVRLHVYWPKQRGDVDAPVKAILDAMEGFAYANDAQVSRMVIEVGVDEERPRIEIEVEPRASHVMGDKDWARELRLLLPPKKRGRMLAKRLVSSARRPT